MAFKQWLTPSSLGIYQQEIHGGTALQRHITLEVK